MFDDLERPTGRRGDTDIAVMGGLVIGTLLGALAWALIALIIAAII